MSMPYYFAIVTPAELDRIRQEPRLADDFIFNRPGDRSGGIGNAWLGIHVVLTVNEGDGDGPLAFIETAEHVDTAPEDHSIMLLRDAATVRQIYAALSVIDEGEFRKRYEKALITENELFPGIWEGADDDTWRYLLENFLKLKTAIARASGDGCALVTKHIVYGDSIEVREVTEP